MAWDAVSTSTHHEPNNRIWEQLYGSRGDHHIGSARPALDRVRERADWFGKPSSDDAAGQAVDSDGCLRFERYPLIMYILRKTTDVRDNNFNLIRMVAACAVLVSH